MAKSKTELTAAEKATRREEAEKRQEEDRIERDQEESQLAVSNKARAPKGLIFLGTIGERRLPMSPAEAALCARSTYGSSFDNITLVGGYYDTNYGYGQRKIQFSRCGWTVYGKPKSLDVSGDLPLEKCIHCGGSGFTPAAK